MKKLLDIMKNPSLNQCFQLELDFKTERHNLKRYLKSLKELKSRAKTSHQYFANSIRTEDGIINSQSSMKKKNSELDYYIINGVKLLKALNSQTKKMNSIYESITNQTKDLIERIDKYLDQSKQSFTKVCQEHEKTVKSYAEKCYPETTTILYILGFVSIQKVKKVEDMIQEQSLSRETETYIAILNTYLDQMETLKNQCKNIFQQYYIGAAKEWLSHNQEMREEIQNYHVQEEELEAYYKETGGAMTDRSDRSSKSRGDAEQQI